MIIHVAWYSCCLAPQFIYLGYSDPSEEVSRILANKLVGNDDVKEGLRRGDSTDSTSSSPNSRTRKESMSQLLKLQQSSKVPRLSGEVSTLS